MNLPESGLIKTRQCSATNQLAKSIPRPDEVDPINGLLRMARENLTVYVPRYSLMNGGIDVLLHMLLDVAIIRFTENGGKQNRVDFSLAEYGKMRGLNDTSSLRKQVSKYLQILLAMQLSYASDNKRVMSFSGIQVCVNYRIKNQIVTIEFSESFAAILRRSSVMYYPKKLLIDRCTEKSEQLFFLAKNF